MEVTKLPEVRSGSQIILEVLTTPMESHLDELDLHAGQMQERQRVLVERVDDLPLVGRRVHQDRHTTRSLLARDRLIAVAPSVETIRGADLAVSGIRD